MTGTAPRTGAGPSGSEGRGSGPDPALAEAAEIQRLFAVPAIHQRAGKLAPACWTSRGRFAKRRPSQGFSGPASGRIAQLVEQLTLNQRVPGSSPGAPTNPFKDLADQVLDGTRAVLPIISRFCFGMRPLKGTVASATRASTLRWLAVSRRPEPVYSRSVTSNPRKESSNAYRDNCSIAQPASDLKCLGANIDCAFARWEGFCWCTSTRARQSIKPAIECRSGKRSC